MYHLKADLLEKIYWDLMLKGQWEKAAKKASSSAGSQLKAREAALKLACPTCKGPMTTYKQLKIHMESKHPGVAIPAEDSFK
ncbi:hypothetical protein BC831DRAFT_553567 [Entophlyctis helioformis]|nr:hypothetical protein BC831DRAFT_553567 [Entophlyctis helioformis]